MDDNAGGMLDIRGTVLRGLIGTSFALRGSGNFRVPPPGLPRVSFPWVCRMGTVCVPRLDQFTMSHP